MTKEECEIETSKAIMEMRNQIAELEKENAELKEQCSILADYNTCHSTCKNENVEMKKQLTKAKEIIKKFSEFVNNEVEFDPEHPQEHTDLWIELCEEAEQFLKDSDIDEAIRQTNEELDFDKIADEVKLTAKQYAMVSDCIERVSANEREFDKDSEEILKEVAEKFKADYKELNKEKAE